MFQNSHLTLFWHLFSSAERNLKHACLFLGVSLQISVSSFFCTSVGHMQWFMGLVHLGGLTFRQESRGSLFVVYKHLTVNVSLSHRHWLKHKYKEAVLTYIILLYTAIWKEIRTDRKLKDCGYMLNLFRQGWEKKKKFSVQILLSCWKKPKKLVSFYCPGL